MLEPFVSDDALVEDIQQARKQRNALHVWWLGQSGFLLRYNDLAMLFDPYLSDSLSVKYASGNNPHVRMMRRAIDPARLTDIDYVISTHSHTDHLDALSLNPILTANAQACFVYPRATQAQVNERITVHPRKWIGTNAGEWVEGVLEAVPAAHDKLEQDAAGNHRYLGYIAMMGPFKIYHSGDGVPFDGLAEIVKPRAVDLAILPINGKLGNMDALQAAQLAKAIGPKLVVPCHYDLFEFNTADPQAEFVPECRRLGQPFHLLRTGERLTLTSHP
ncbi:MAG: MBL fold metallo-hydrolase [Phycisphaerales bacterium]|nr:MBL fold metallo-hydrolase [Phycisphaerales bacterium]